MDWRQMAGRPTVVGMPIGEKLWAWSGGRKIGYGWREDQWDGRMDPMRGWIIAFCWIVACSAEYVDLSKLISTLLIISVEKIAFTIYTNLFVDRGLSSILL